MWNNENEARAQIKALVAEYYHQFKDSKPVFHPGDRVNYGGRVFDEKEMLALTDAALDFWLTTGRFSAQFEKAFAEYMGVRYAHIVNSGSSANLLAFMALTASELGERRIRPGDEVITVACAFPTTVAPILQYGAVPVFVDVTIPQYNIDTTLLEAAYSERTKAVMIAHTLGNPFDIKAVKAFCGRHGLWLIEDNCDALGSEYTLDGQTRLTGAWGDIGTSSFYPPHHMTMGEGGCVYTNDPRLSKLVLSYRDWGRDCVTTGALVSLFCEKWGDGARWIDQSEKNAPHEAGLLKLDCSRMKSVFGWQPAWRIEQAVEKVVHFERLRLRGVAPGAEMDAQIKAYREKTF